MPEEILRLLEAVVEPKTRADSEKLGVTLQQMAADDPRLGVTTDMESGQTILQGVSEQHLEEVARLLMEQVAVNFGAPQVIYRETLTRRITITYTHRKVLNGGMGEFAKITIEFAPLPDGTGFVFVNAVDDDSLSDEFILAVERGIRSQKEAGLVAGFPLTDFQAMLTDCVYHIMDSSARTFNIAARAALRDLAKQGAVELAEPVMKVEVAIPQDFLGSVIGDLNSRRGQLETTIDGEVLAIVRALVPLSNLFGYAGTLDAMCKGRSLYDMRFDHFTPMALKSPEDDPKFPGAMAMRVA